MKCILSNLSLRSMYLQNYCTGHTLSYTHLLMNTPKYSSMCLLNRQDRTSGQDLFFLFVVFQVICNRIPNCPEELRSRIQNMFTMEGEVRIFCPHTTLKLDGNVGLTGKKLSMPSLYTTLAPYRSTGYPVYFGDYKILTSSKAESLLQLSLTTHTFSTSLHVNISFVPLSLFQSLVTLFLRVSLLASKFSTSLRVNISSGSSSLF